MRRRRPGHQLYLEGGHLGGAPDEKDPGQQEEEGVGHQLVHGLPVQEQAGVDLTLPATAAMNLEGTAGIQAHCPPNTRDARRVRGKRQSWKITTNKKPNEANRKRRTGDRT